MKKNGLSILLVCSLVCSLLSGCGIANASSLEALPIEGQVTANYQTNNDSSLEMVEVSSEADQVDLSEVPYDLAYPEAFASGAVSYSDTTILIKFKKSARVTLTKTLKKAGVEKLEEMFRGQDYKWYTAYLAEGSDVTAAMAVVRQLDTIITAEYDYIYDSSSEEDLGLAPSVSANELSEKQYVLNQCGTTQAWNHLAANNINAGGMRGITVAVIDTGVDYTHEDLNDNMWTNQGEIPDNGIDDDDNGYIDDYYGVDIIAKKGSGMDDQGHGTHVAGIIAAENNNIGVVGIAYNTKIMAIKAGDPSGTFAQSNIAEAIIYAYTHGADVINMSFGGNGSSIAVQDALSTAYLHCILVASAGNDGKPNEETRGWEPVPTYPADYSYVLGVMSCGSSNIESSFSNWDVKLYNEHEYEVYAPGEAIWSTLPGNRYAQLSGTSMAAPVVAAQAALLRSYYSDRDSYPTKFIYGQIVGTTDNVIRCCNSAHGDHNIPGKINIYASFSQSPTPELGVSDYKLFDTAGFDADTTGFTTGCEEVNDGDGVPDAGETIALGITLRNRWGMSKDTVVHVSAESEKGVVCPYVEILNNDVNFGSVGTYSESDSGKILSSDQWIAWEKPFYIKISKDCPNNYNIKFKFTITCNNGLNDSDQKVYINDKTYITLTIQKGVVLPSRITEDMTLTKDNYYIIPNETFVEKGATLTIEAGTKVQFWPSDLNEATAETSITYLQVDGSLFCNGTENEPVELFPSDWMSGYEVCIKGNGEVDMEYTNITNPNISAYQLVNCEFKQTIENKIYGYRVLEDNEIKTYGRTGSISANSATNCAFYKLSPFSLHIDQYNGCAFVDSNINYNSATKTSLFDNCLFYGNSGTFGVRQRATNMTVTDVYRNEEIGSTYVAIYLPNSLAMYEYDRFQSFAKKHGFSMVEFETEEEFTHLISCFEKDYENDNYSFYVGSSIFKQGWDYQKYEDGNSFTAAYNSVACIIKDGLFLNGSSYDGGWRKSSYRLMFEIPDGVLDVQSTSISDTIQTLWDNDLAENYNPSYYHNAIINRTSKDNSDTFMKVTAPSTSSSTGIEKVYFGQNYWGTSNTSLMKEQVMDGEDYASLLNLDISNYLTEAPATTFPFVVDAYLTVGGEKTSTVANEEVTFVVEFNRAMDTDQSIQVTWGSSYPYREYEVEGSFVSSTRWQGTAKLSTLIENGYQYWSISDGRTAADENGNHLKLYTDTGRFPFKVDTSHALALTMYGSSTEDGVELSWTQDDYDTLAGYNVYRADSEDGEYEKLNTTFIPADTKTWLDQDVVAKKTYYYNFTVVETDFTESSPSGKVAVLTEDYEAPTISHSPIAKATVDNNLTVSATITDNVAVESAYVYYSVKGSGEWKRVLMTHNGSKYSAVIYSNYITEAGFLYYIDAFDGVAHAYKGSEEEPFEVEIEVPLTEKDMGDVDCDGTVEREDAMLLLNAINGKANLTEKQFVRADLDGDGVLTAKEALQVLLKANGTTSHVGETSDQTADMSLTWNEQFNEDGTFLMQLVLSGGADVGAGDFQISYSKTLMECVNVSVNASVETSGAILVLKEDTSDGNICFSYVNEAGCNTDEVLLDITFAPVLENRTSTTLLVNGTNVVNNLAQDVTLRYNSQTITIPKEPEVLPCEHQWDEGIIYSGPNCTKEGIRLYTCTLCNEQKQEPIPALGHTPGTEKTEKMVKATCTTEGSYDSAIYCEVCGAEVSREHKTIAKLGHALTHHEAISASCTGTGQTEYWNCSRCYKYFGDVDCTLEIQLGDTILPVLDHTLVYVDYVGETCTTDGMEAHYQCSRCNSCFADSDGTAGLEAVGEEEFIRPAQGHYITSIAAKAATCTEAGWYAYEECANCDYTTYVEIPQKAHTLLHNEGKEATCTTAGYKAYDACINCDYTTFEVVPALGHSWNEEWSNNEASHWHICIICGEKKDQRAHTSSGAATEGTGETCTVCGYTIAPALGHIHTNHLTAVAAKEATCLETGNTAYYICDCGMWFADAKATNEIKDHSSVMISLKSHTEEIVPSTNATCTGTGLTEGRICSVCGEILLNQTVIPATGHNWSSKWVNNSNSHWHACLTCGYKKDAADHVSEAPADEDNAETCSVCGYTISPALGHIHSRHMTAVSSKEATCTETGNTAYYVCDCGMWFTDDKATNEIKDHSSVIVSAKGHSKVAVAGSNATCTETGLTEGCVCSVCGETLLEQTIIPATGHKAGTEIVPATGSKDGTVTTFCTICHEVLDDVVVINKVGTTKLSTTKYTYSGGVKNPTLTVKDSLGNVIPTTEYSVTKSSGRKYVGSYKYTIVFKNHYSGTKTLTFTIVPKGTTISKLTAAKAGFKATWKKQSTQTTGYQIRYATSSKMTSAKTVTITKNTTISKSVSKLKSKKKYYVQIRTYKTVSGKKYYSGWSTAKTVTTK